ncbi:MAG TPA: hypothetical protein VIU44_15925 [Gaiellaceae bacterium]
MNIWNYDAATGALLSAGVADPDPLSEGDWLVPACATTVAPPSVPPGKAAVFSNGSWSLIPDHRGETWWRAYGEAVVVSAVGDPAQSGLFAVEPAAPPPTAENVQAERTRRLARGFNYTFPNGDPRGTVRIGTTETDMAGWDEVTKLAAAEIATGNASTEINILTDTGPVVVTAQEWQSVLIAAGNFRQPIWAASFALQAQSPIPASYADDSHWPK